LALVEPHAAARGTALDRHAVLVVGREAVAALRAAALREVTDLLLRRRSLALAQLLEERFLAFREVPVLLGLLPLAELLSQAIPLVHRVVSPSGDERRRACGRAGRGPTRTRGRAVRGRRRSGAARVRARTGSRARSRPGPERRRPRPAS